MRCTFVLSILICAVGSCLVPVLPAQPQKEPTIDGKPLRKWAQILKTADRAKDREQAAIALGEMGTEARSAMPVLLEALNDRTLRVRMRTIAALEQIGPPAKAAVPALQAMLKETTSKKNRKDILRALEAIQASSAIWTLPRLRAFGLHVKELSPELVSQLDLQEGQGLVITHVESESSAEQAGMKVHDILLEIDDKQVPHNIPALLKLLETVEVGQPVQVVLLRGGVFQTLKSVKLPKWHPTPVVGDPTLRVSYSIKVEGERFVGTYQCGSTKIEVEGTVVNGKAVSTSAVIFHDQIKEKYESVKSMPQKYRKFARKLVPSILAR